MVRYLVLVVLLLTQIQFSYSQLSLQIKQIDETGNINTSAYPVMSAEVKAIYNGNQVELKKEDIKILENNSVFTAKALSISPINNGWQKLEWIPEQYIFSPSYQVLIYAMHNNVLTNGFGVGRFSRYPYTIVTDQNDLQIRDVFFGNVPNGAERPYQVRFRSQVNTENIDGPYSLRLDSITTNTRFFEIYWIGSDSDFDRSPPPRSLRVNSSYWLNVIFKPEENIPYQDVLTFHYEGGLKRIVPLYGNSFTVQTESLIQLVEPNGGELLAPCEIFQIKWRGHAPQFPVELYYSTNDGFTWNYITEVKDSVYNWKVPDIQANRLIVKVRQSFNQKNNYNLGKDTRNTLDAGFNQYSTQLTFINQIGNLLTYDLTNTPPVLKQFNYLNDEFDIGTYTSSGLVYSPYDSLYYVSYVNNAVSYNAQKDTIAAFNPNEKYPIRKFVLDENIRIKEIKADNNNSMIAVVPVFGNQVNIYDSKNFDFIKTFTFKTQVIDFSFNSKLNQAAALMLDGEVEIIDLNTNATIKQLSFNEFPNFVQIALSPNGKLLSIGSKSDNSGLQNNVYVVEIETGKIVRVFSPSQGDPIGLFFNPSSSTLITGSRTEMQIAFFDLSTSNNSGQLYGHSTRMNDIKLAPNGLSLISTGAIDDNAVYRTFVYPEEDRSDAHLSIRRPELNLDKIVFEPVYLGTTNEYNINNVCNISQVVATFPSATFKSGIYYSLKNNWNPISVSPTECLNFDLVITPLDTGFIRDTLAIRSCNSDYLLPFEIKVLPRNITYLNANYDFGDVCLGETATKELELLRNNDPVPLIVNYLLFESPHNRNFSVTIPKTDTIVPPGGTLSGIIKFFPDTLGNYNTKVTTFHSNQVKMKGIFDVKGKGIGSYIEFSHNKLQFIPEVLTRELTLKNIGVTDIIFNNFSVSPADNFEFISQASFILKPGESKTVEIRWNGVKQKANLVIDATPCLAQNTVPLDFFNGFVELIIPKIETSATNENVTIPIEIKPNDKEPYKGIRPFEATFEVNPKIFLPTSVESNMGTATLVSNEINGNRQFKVRVEGNFDNAGVFATIKGVAGLTDTNYSDLTINTLSPKFGEYVVTVVRNGSIFINDICDDRYIQNEKSSIIIKNIAPNPAKEFVTLSFDSESLEPIKIVMLDNLGEVIFTLDYFKPKIGSNDITFDVSNIGIGNYSINIYQLDKSIQTSFIIMR